MIRAEAEAEIDRGVFYRQKNQFQKAVDIALDRMIEWMVALLDDGCPPE